MLPKQRLFACCSIFNTGNTIHFPVPQLFILTQFIVTQVVDRLFLACENIHCFSKMVSNINTLSKYYDPYYYFS